MHPLQTYDLFLLTLRERTADLKRNARRPRPSSPPSSPRRLAWH